MKKTVYLKKAGVYAAFLLPVFICGVAGGDTFFNIAVSLVAVTYLLMLNDGMRAAYLLCAVYAVSYAAVGFASALYATAVFHACVLLPTAVFRFVVSRKKHIGADICRLKIKGWTAALSCCALLVCALYFLLKRIGDAQPFLDGLILAVSVVTSILMLKNYLEMWWFNLFSSLLYVVLWIVQFISIGEGLAFAGMQTVVSLINLRGVVKWIRADRKNHAQTARGEAGVDLLIFGGQSNMQGQTEAELAEPPVEGAEEYTVSTDSLRPLRHPVGEDIGDLLLGAHLGRGSLVPYFAAAYIAETGKNVVAVHAAKGATLLSQWEKGSETGKERYAKTIEKIAAAKRKCGGIEKVYYIWLQGESDALAATEEKSYRESLVRFKNDLKADAGIDSFMIIEVGYFASHFGGGEKDEKIMRAQEEVCREEEDFVLLTDITKKLSLDERYTNPEAVGHYNNAAMKIIGETAGKAAARYRKGVF